MSPRVCVIGAGVIGLSSALRVFEVFPDADVTVIAKQFSPFTTSDVSGGFWKPYRIGNTPAKSVKEWSEKTFGYMVNLAVSPIAKNVGAKLVSGTTRGRVFDYRNLTEKEIRRFPGMRHGVFYRNVVLEPSLYLPWLMKRFTDKGGKLKKMFITSLSELVFENYDVIVNCTGVAVKHLVNDHELEPGRGQIIRVEAPWVKDFCICNGPDELSYIFPGASFVVLGGTDQRGNWDKTAREADRKLIWESCCRYCPQLKEAKIIGDWVGFRPHRTTVRLELEYLNLKGKRQAVVHNYGHGGGGICLHWGCAEDAAKLVKQAFEDLPLSKL